MGADTGLEPKPAEANSGDRQTTKLTMGDVASLEPNAAEAKYKIPSNTFKSKGRRTLLLEAWSTPLLAHKSTMLEFENKSSKNAKKKERNENVDDWIAAAPNKKVQ